MWINLCSLKKILLFAGNSCLSIPLVLITLGTIYLSQSKFAGLSRQSAGKFSFSTKAKAVTKNTYNKYTDLPSISEHKPNHKSNLTSRPLRGRDELGYFFFSWFNRRRWLVW